MTLTLPDLLCPLGALSFTSGILKVHEAGFLVPAPGNTRSWMGLATFFWLSKALLLLSGNFHFLLSFTGIPTVGSWPLSAGKVHGTQGPWTRVLLCLGGRCEWCERCQHTGVSGEQMDPNGLAIFPFCVGLGELYSGVLTFLSEVLMLSLGFLTRIFRSKCPNLRDGGKQPHRSPLTLPVLGDEPRTSCTFLCCSIY